jgi:acyl carrier protein
MTAGGGGVTEAEIYAVLQEIVAAELVAGPVSLAPDTVLDELRGWDSVALAGVVVAIETRFGNPITRAELGEIRRAEDLALLVRARSQVAGGQARAAGLPPGTSSRSPRG